MANKFVVVLVMCLVVVAAVQLPTAKADEFASCFNTCADECKQGGQGETFCEMKCDTDCTVKDVAARMKKAMDEQSEN